MENKRQVGGSSLDHLFGPKHSSSPSPSSSSGSFASIFSPPSTQVPAVRGHGIIGNHQLGSGKCGNPDNGPKGGNGERDKSSLYQSETAEPCYFSSSIYYGGQENYSPRTASNQESQHMFKKDGDDDANGNNATGASRGNWWQGSLYY